MNGKKLKTHWIVVSIINLLIVTVIVLSTILLKTHTPTLKDHYIAASFGIAAGLLSYIMAFVINNIFCYTPNDQLLTEVSSIRRGFIPHDDTTQKILDVVQEKYLTLVSYDRKDLIGTGFYNDFFKNSQKIKVSGISIQKFLKSLLNDRHIIRQQLLKKNNMSVKILFMHPQNPVVQILNEQEANLHEQDPVSQKIRESLSILKQIADTNSTITLKANCRLEVRMTMENMNSTMTYAGGKKNHLADGLLMGFLFGHKQGGPLYQIPMEKNYNESVGLHKDCLNYFDDLYEQAKDNTVFLWDDKACTFANKYDPFQ